jgi:hypothetical protein
LCEFGEVWDVVKLSGIHRGMPATVRQLRKGRRLVAFLQRQTGAAAYVVNTKAARAYLAGLARMAVPYDHAFDQVWHFGLLLRGVLPLPVRTPRGSSTIGYERRRINWPGWSLQRVDRLRTESRRILHYTFVDTQWMRHMFDARPKASE